VKKDLHDFYSAYEEAGVHEYWIADARGALPLLRIVSAGSGRRFVERVPDAQAWVHSPLFARAFWLTSFADRAGLRNSRLEMRTT
jgi:hypothetical protein